MRRLGPGATWVGRAAQVALAAALLVQPSVASCVPEAIPPELRWNLTINGVSLPFKIHRFAWISALLLGEIVTILANEKLGYNTVHTFFNHWGDWETQEAYLSTMGCRLPWNWTLGVPPCNPGPMEEALAHAALEYWTSFTVGPEVWKVQQPDRVPDELGSVGYSGNDGIFVKQSELMRVKNSTGTDLTWYSNWQEPWNSPAASFAPASSLPPPLSCSRVRAWFPETAGYESEGLQCVNGWWGYDLCAKREPPMANCVPIIFSLYNPIVSFRLWRPHNMAGMIGFYNISAYEEVARNHNVPFYWYTPDYMFVNLKPVRIRYPDHDPQDWLNTWPVTDLYQVDLIKLTMKELNSVAPILGKFIDKVQLTSNLMDSLLTAYTVHQNVTRAACEWLADPDSRSVWAAWIPDPTDCAQGQGVANTTAGRVGCRFCNTGMYSERSAADRVLHCVDCPAGQYQGLPGTTRCDLCPAGQAASAEGSTKCSGCPRGTYSGLAARECTACPAGLTTLDINSDSLQACVCDVGFYGSEPLRACKRCPSGTATRFPGASYEDDCKFETWVPGLATGVACGTVCLMGTILAAGKIVRQRLAHLTALKDRILEERLRVGLDSVAELGHPMVCISATNFFDLAPDELSSLHEGVRDTGKLLVLDNISSVLAFKANGNLLVLLSYQWLSYTRPGPNEVQLAAMRAAVLNLCNLKGTSMDQVYIWLDIISVPQFHAGLKTLAVRSLYVYASLVDILVVVAPQARHEDTGVLADATTYRSRVWCRAEQFAHICHNGQDSVYIQSSEDGNLEKVDGGWFNNVCCIFDGEMTCCRKKHVDCDVCDRETLVPMLIGLYYAVYSEHCMDTNTRQCAFYELIAPQKDLIFPRTFAFSTAQGEHERELFGDMIPRIERLVDGDACSAVVRARTKVVHALNNSNAREAKVPTAAPYDLASVAKPKSI